MSSCEFASSKVRSRLATVGVVIVNWNGWSHTIAACQSVLQSTYPALTITVVDNASADDSLAELRNALLNVEIIANPQNSGFAGGCNIGIRHARELGCDYIFLLNNDALVEPKAIERLVDASKAMGDHALLGSAIRFIASGEYQFFGSHTRSDVFEPEFFTTKRNSELLSQEFIETDFILGAALFLPTAALEIVGTFDERFFLNYEEADLCYRARKCNVPSYVVPASIVRHHANSSMGVYPAPMQAYFLTRNRFLFAEIHAPPCQRTFKSRLKIIYWDLRRLLSSNGRRDLSMRAILRAFWDYTWRQFGDCPTVIRRNDALYRGLSYRPSSAPYSKQRVTMSLTSLGSV